MTSSETTATDNLKTLACWMAGDFSNFNQAQTSPQKFAHIHVLFRPLPFAFFSGIGFYSEQVYDHDLWTPYRQGVHRLVAQEGAIYIENYALQDSIRFAGAARELSILQTLTQDCLKRRQGCSMVFRREAGCFRGEVEGNQCLIQRDGHPTYLVSEVEITESTWSSLDRGFDLNTHAQVWGSEHGALQFEKRQDFSHEFSFC
jgi:CpeT protein